MSHAPALLATWIGPTRTLRTIVFLGILFPVSVCCAGEPAVTFDAPALIGVRELIKVDHPVPAGSAHVPESTGLSSSQKTIEVIIPVTSEIRLADRGNVQEFRFNVYWNRNVYPICDYAPKTQTFSEIDGLIAVDKTSEKSAALGLNLKSGYHDIISGTSTAEFAKRDGDKIHYSEVPQHEVLVASGTTHRGTGAFFRFHPSRKQTLEGGRDLVVAFQVPRSWRGGVLQIECEAHGNRKVIAWNEPFEVRRAFIVPIYLEGDDQARKAAIEFVQAEQGLRKMWNRMNRQSEQPSGDVLQQVHSMFNGRKNPLDDLPADWVHYLIQSSDIYLEKYRQELPNELADSAGQFVEARIALLKLGR